jgi:hypothetical protein
MPIGSSASISACVLYGLPSAVVRGRDGGASSSDSPVTITGRSWNSPRAFSTHGRPRSCLHNSPVAGANLRYLRCERLQLGSIQAANIKIREVVGTVALNGGATSVRYVSTNASSHAKSKVAFDITVIKELVDFSPPCAQTA